MPVDSIQEANIEHLRRIRPKTRLGIIPSPSSLAQTTEQAVVTGVQRAINDGIDIMTPDNLVRISYRNGSVGGLVDLLA